MSVCRGRSGGVGELGVGGCCSSDKLPHLGRFRRSERSSGEAFISDEGESVRERERKRVCVGGWME